MPSTNSITSELLRLAVARGPDKTFCPSEAARNLWPGDWRDHMDDVRSEAARLIDTDLLVCTQHGETADIATAKGPIRLAAKV